MGAGIQFMDEFGIHVVPEVRYTRWIEPIFNNLSTTPIRTRWKRAISLTLLKVRCQCVASTGGVP